jgi:hypothetical protein
LLSGHPDPNVRQQFVEGGLLGAGQTTYYDLMERIAKDKKGDGWTVEPLSFVLKSLEFAEPDAIGVAKIPAPRETTDEVPLLIPVIFRKKGSDKTEFKLEKARAQLAMGYFWITGYWVFKCKKGEQEETFAIAIEGQVHNMSHAPFGNAYRDELLRIAGKYRNDKSIAAWGIGRPHDTGPAMRNELNAARNGEYDIFRFVKKMRGGSLDIPEDNIIPLWHYVPLPPREKP